MVLGVCLGVTDTPYLRWVWLGGQDEALGTEPGVGPLPLPQLDPSVPWEGEGRVGPRLKWRRSLKVRGFSDSFKVNEQSEQGQP